MIRNPQHEEHKMTNALLAPIMSVVISNKNTTMRGKFMRLLRIVRLGL